MTPEEPKPGGDDAPLVVADDPVPLQGCLVIGLVPAEPIIEPGLVFGSLGETDCTCGGAIV